MKISSQNSIIKEYKYWINILLTIINSNISQHCNHEASIQIVKLVINILFKGFRKNRYTSK